jgi:hypothetical protein
MDPSQQPDPIAPPSGYINGRVAVIVDLVLKVVGAGGILTVVVYLIQLSHSWGEMQATVREGFAANNASHLSIISNVGQQGDRIEAQGRRIDELTRSVGKLEGVSGHKER